MNILGYPDGYPILECESHRCLPSSQACLFDTRTKYVFFMPFLRMITTTVFCLNKNNETANLYVSDDFSAHESYTLRTYCDIEGNYKKLV